HEKKNVISRYDAYIVCLNRCLFDIAGIWRRWWLKLQCTFGGYKLYFRQYRHIDLRPRRRVSV
ncbi:MAG: hypothetical protein ABSG94_12505, partial [Brevinematales bacterium]